MWLTTLSFLPFSLPLPLTGATVDGTKSDTAETTLSCHPDAVVAFAASSVIFFQNCTVFGASKELDGVVRVGVVVLCVQHT